MLFLSDDRLPSSNIRFGAAPPRNVVGPPLHLETTPLNWLAQLL